MTAVREALEELGHPVGALPQPRLLADLFVRFQARVPLRPAPAGRPAAVHLAAWLEEGAGCCGEGRVGAFESLAAEAGFGLSRGVARSADGTGRPVLLADRQRLLLDAGFPLPAPLLLDPPAGGENTGYGTLSVRTVADGGIEVVLETRGDERGLFRVEAPGDRAGAGREERASSPTAARGRGALEPSAHDPVLFRLLGDRLLRWRDGVLEVSDAWSRLRLPLAAEDAEGLEALFGPPVAGPATEPRPPRPGFVPTLAVYHFSATEPARLRRLLADPGAHAALLPAGWVTEGLTLHDDGFDRTLLENGTFLRRERVAHLPDGVEVTAEGPLALFRTRTWRLESRPGGTRLRLLASLRDPAPPRGLAEATRRRLVFELASELLALDRFAAED